MFEYFQEKINQVMEWIRNSTQYVITAVPDKGGIDQVEGRKVGPSDPQYQIPVRRMAQYGYRSLPPNGSENILVTPNAAFGNKCIVASENRNFGPSDLEEGEVSLFSKFKQLLRLKTDGKLTIDSGKDNAGNQADIILNGGTAKVARVGDQAKTTIRTVYTVVPGTPPGFNLTCSAVSPDGLSSTVLFQFTVVAGAVTVPTLPGVPYDVEVDSEIFQGAPHVLS